MKPGRHLIFFIVVNILMVSGRFQAVGNVNGDTLKVAEIFNDQMVLQRNQEINVWGTAGAQKNVTIEFLSKVYETSADALGAWRISLPPAAPGGPHRLTITSGSSVISFDDIYIGDVWLASGQSNMAFRFKAASDPDKKMLTAEAGKHNIRMYDVAKVVSGGKLLNGTNKAWAKADSSNVKEWSAVAFYFAKGLYEHLNVPIGIINCNQGGSRIEAWMNAKALREAAVPETKLSGIFAAYQNPSVLYTKMLSEIIPYTLKGVIWYQGESNAGEADAYRRLFPALIRQWREEWNQPDLPFLFAQLPGFARKEDKTQESWALFRKTQEEAAKAQPHTGMIVLIDAGDKDDIHPTNKKVVGERFVLAARAVAYKEDVDYSGPMAKKILYKDGRVVISYDHADEGLMAKGGEIKGFFVCDEEGDWHPASATIRNNKVYVSHPQKKEIIGVRYGWANAPVVNLYDRHNLPAAPFYHAKKNG